MESSLSPSLCLAFINFSNRKELFLCKMYDHLVFMCVKVDNIESLYI